jgi:hypothetical protein
MCRKIWGVQPQELQLDSELVWSLRAEFSADQTAVQTPASAIEVKDLQSNHESHE